MRILESGEWACALHGTVQQLVEVSAPNVQQVSISGRISV